MPFERPVDRLPTTRAAGHGAEGGDLLRASDQGSQRYRFVRRLKSGQGVETTLAVDLQTGQDVVVKTTSATVLSAEARLRLEHEVAVLGGLRTSGFAPVVEAGHDGGVLYVVMPYVPGVTLAEHLRGGALPVLDALTVARSLLSALAEVHAHGVLHCDVKPANVIVGPSFPDGVTLIDFGFSRSALLPAPVRDRPAGTAWYMAPEQAGLLDRTVDERADLYSVGIVLFECLTGRPPFDAGTIGEVLRDQLSTPPPSMRSLGIHVPTVVEEIVQRLLRKDPDDRYRSAGAVIADIDAVAAALRRGVEEPAIVVGAHDSRQTLAEPALIGRDADLAVLGGHLEDARQGLGRLLVLEGNSGVGKSRLLDELSQRAIGSGFQVLRGRGAERVASRPLQVLAGVIADLITMTQSDPTLAVDIAHRVGDARNRICDVLPELADVLGGPLPEPAGPESYAQVRSVAALVGLLDALGSPDRPALVVLDDCQWADEITLRVLIEWARGVPGVDRPARHVVVVAAVRPEDLDVQSPLRSLPSVPHLELHPLAPDEVNQVVESMAGAVPPEAAEIVLELSGGNPFMVSAVLRGLVEAGSLARGQAGWRLDQGMAGPRASREAAAFLSRRLELLAPDTRRLLKAAAVLGRDFDLSLARVLAGQDRATTDLAVAQAIRRHIIWKDPADQCTFVHDRLREVLLGALEPDELAGLHRRAAEEIEGADPSRAFELAYHFDAAGVAGRALTYALNSGKAARSRHDLELAERQYRIAERGLAGGDRDTRREVAEALGQISMLRGRYDQAEQHLETAVRLAADKVSSARIEGQLGELAFKRDQVEVAAARLEAALGVLGQRVPRGPLSLVVRVVHEILRRPARRLNPFGRPRATGEEAGVEQRLTAHLLARLQYVWWFKRRRLATVWVMMRHLNVAERGGECPELAHIYAIHGAGMALTFPFLWRRGLHYTARAIEIHERQGNLWGQGQAWSMRGCVLHAAGKFANGVEACSRGAALLEQYGDPWELNFAGWNRALCLYRLGRAREAVDQARRTYQASVEVGDAQAETIALEIWARAVGGQVGADRVHAALRHGADIHSSAAALQAEALSLRAAGRPHAALVSMDKAAGVVRDARSRNIYVTPVFPWLATLAREAAEQAGSAPDARATLRYARRSARRAVRCSRIYRHDLPHALREAAVIAALSGRPWRARRLFDRSADIAARHEAVGEYAETLGQRQRLSIPIGRRGARSRLAATGLVVEERDSLARLPTLGLADRFANLLDAGGRLASALTSADIATAVHETVLSLLRAEECVVVGLGSEGLDSNESTRFVGRDLGRQALERRRPVVLTDAVAPDVGPSDSVVLAGVRSALCAPIFVRDEPVGYFLAIHTRVDSLFGPEEERLAEFIARLAGATLEREQLQHEIRARVVIAQEAERSRVARDLHDEVGQALTSVLLGVRLVESCVQDVMPDTPELLRPIAELRRVSGDALTTVQQLAFELRPTVLDDLGLVPALRRLVGDMTSRHDMPIHLETGELGTGDRLPSEAETTAYRVVQEALTNVVRHSKASMCSVVLARARGNLRAVVEDDGIGFDDAEPGVLGLGLRGMSERAALAGGILRITSAYGEGTTVVLEVPVA